MTAKATGYAVVIDGKTYAIEDKETWLRLRLVLDNYVALLESKRNLSAPLNAPADETTISDRDETLLPYVSVVQRHNTVGTRAIDALLLALDANGGTMSYAAAPAVVEKFGWNASEAKRPASMVSIRARRYPEWIIIANSTYTLTEAGFEMVKRIKAALAQTDAHAGTPTDTAGKENETPD